MNEEGTYKTNGAQGRQPLEPRPFLPKKGNYRGLIVYKKAECIYDITFYFAHHYFVERMTAARLGYRSDQKTRIAELEAEIAALKAENTALKARIAELEAQQKGGIQ